MSFCDGFNALNYCTSCLPEACFCGVTPVTPQFSLEAVKVNLRETDDKLIVEAELPGFEKEDISVLLADSTLSISAERKESKEEKDDYVLKESSSETKYQRSLLLPFEADGDAIKAYYNAGILRIDIPKPADAEAGKHIEIN